MKTNRMWSVMALLLVVAMLCDRLCRCAYGGTHQGSRRARCYDRAGRAEGHHPACRCDGCARRNRGSRRD